MSSFPEFELGPVTPKHVFYLKASHVICCLVVRLYWVFICVYPLTSVSPLEFLSFPPETMVNVRPSTNANRILNYWLLMHRNQISMLNFQNSFRGVGIIIWNWILTNVFRRSKSTWYIWSLFGSFRSLRIVALS